MAGQYWWTGASCDLWNERCRQQKRYRTLARLSMEESMQNFPPKDSLDQAVNIYERELIQRAFTATSGNITEAAKILNIPRQTLQRKIKQYQIRQANE